MKKLISFAVLAMALSTTILSCSKDDDSSSNNKDCTTCTSEKDGLTTSTTVCDNQDGTITINVNGVESTIPGNYDVYIQALAATGANCN